MPDRQNNIILGVGLGTFVFIVTGFVAALSGAHSGEIAGALGGILGGVIGAMGSAGSVYIMLKGQRDEEIEKVSAAVLREVSVLAKSPVGQLSACAMIQSGQIRCPKYKIGELFQTPAPIIYPAIADRIGRLHRPTLVVAFYTQLQETRGLVAITENNEPTTDVVTGAHIQELADLLISQCQLAQMILSSVEPDPERETALMSGQRAHMLHVLAGELAAARLAFPNAESFRGQ